MSNMCCFADEKLFPAEVLVFSLISQLPICFKSMHGLSGIGESVLLQPFRREMSTNLGK